MLPKQTAFSAGTVLHPSSTISARLFDPFLASCVNAATREHYMASEVKTDSELEIAHVLFIDTVGYSKLRIKEQRELLDELNRIVRATHSVCASEAAGTLIRIPTGDGMVLVFSDRPDAPAECALEITLASKQSPHFLLRMGIHSGPVSRVLDVNDRANAAGAGINIAQRVMSCGDAGHILLSKHAADDLIEYERWRPFLHEIGEHEVKHGVRVGLVNLYNDDIGNPKLPACFAIAEKAGVGGAFGFSRWRKVALTSVATLAIITLAWIGYAVLFPKRPLPPPVPQTVSPPSAPSNNSIAVLPFDNLSNDKQNAYFADSVQDEILTHLAKVAGLKVISRTSVMQYRNTGHRNLREIAKELGVAHILEGTVERSGGRIRLRAQLIDGRSDSHLWGEVYNGDLGDVFALESRLAQQIVSQLRAKLSPQEKAAIEEQPTVDLTAYDLYAHAKALISEAVFNAKRKESLEEAVRLLTEATARDPAFFRAYYQLAHAHDQLYFIGADRTGARLELANAAIQAVHRLHPDSGEAHLALAKHLYWGSIDIDRARQELIAAGRLLPNDPIPLLLAGYIDRRQGRWADSLREMEKALELDPRNFFILQQISLTYEILRRYADAAATLDHAFSLAPENVAIRVRRAFIEIEWRADTKPLHSTIQAAIAKNPEVAGSIAERWMDLAVYERDGDGAARALKALTVDGCLPMPHVWCEGIVAQIQGNGAAANAAFSLARVQLEQTVRDQPDYAEALGGLGLVDAVLGHREEAILMGRRAVQLLPVSKDSVNGSDLVRNLAAIYAWTDKKDSAIEQLEIATRMPGYLSYGDLVLHPDWDPLRNDPRFGNIVASLAP